jgi:DNA-directed RNA polymerase specialized sigma24 family protein
MHWFKNTNDDWRKSELASPDDVSIAFSEQLDSLIWLALVITGDQELARRSIVDACSLSRERSGVFREWLNHWAHAATARESVHAVRDAIKRSSDRYADYDCDHADHPLLSRELVAAVDANELIAELDPCARAVLVFRAILRGSVSDCAAALGIPRKTVRCAYCAALTWIQKHTAQHNAAAQPEHSAYEEVCLAAGD